MPYRPDTSRLQATLAALRSRGLSRQADQVQAAAAGRPVTADGPQTSATMEYSSTKEWKPPTSGHAVTLASRKTRTRPGRVETGDWILTVTGTEDDIIAWATDVDVALSFGDTICLEFRGGRSGCVVPDRGGDGGYRFDWNG